MAHKRRRGASKADFDKISRDCRRVLRKLCGADLEVSIDLESSRKMPGYFGYAQKLGPRKYVIKLASDMDKHLLVAMAVHEVSHVLHWEMGTGGYGSPHDKNWGVAYAICYRAIYKVR